MITGLPQLIITGAGTHPHFMRLHFVITYIVWAVEFFREKSIYVHNQKLLDLHCNLIVKSKSD